MSIDQDILALSQNFAMRTNSLPSHGVLGDVNGTITDPLLPLTNVYVRVPTSNGLSARLSVILPSSANVQLLPGWPVLLGYDHNLNPIVLGTDTQTAAATGVASTTTVANANSVSTTQAMFETLALVSAGGMIVNLKGWNVIANDVYTAFSYSGIDLTSYIPSTGETCYATIFVLADLSGVEVVASTPVLISDFPDPQSDINECLAGKSAGSTATWAIALVGGMTSMNQYYVDTNSKDLRQLVNNADGTSYALLTTTNNTVTTIASVGIAQLSAATITGSFIATKSDYTASATGTFRYGVRRASGGNVTQIAAASIAQDEDSSGSPALSLDVDTGTQTVRIRGTGVSAETWYWKVSYTVLSKS